MKGIRTDDKHRSAEKRSWIIEDDYCSVSPLRSMRNDGDL